MSKKIVDALKVRANELMHRNVKQKDELMSDVQNLLSSKKIHHHNNKGNTKGNLISELNNEKYITHKISSNPKDKLTSDKANLSINEYINEINNIKKID